MNKGKIYYILGRRRLYYESLNNERAPLQKRGENSRIEEDGR
jgi:hypothetical protein